jgi:predicted ATP-grasp superfamily ATP-dependent carboligase
MCVVNVRRIKPGTYEEFRRAWQPDPWPEALERVVISRNIEDPDEVCTIGYFAMSADDLDAFRDNPEFVVAETGRIARLAQYEEALLVNAIYELAEEVTAPSRPSS